MPLIICMSLEICTVWSGVVKPSLVSLYMLYIPNVLGAAPRVVAQASDRVQDWLDLASQCSIASKMGKSKHA